MKNYTECLLRTFLEVLRQDSSHFLKEEESAECLFFLERKDILTGLIKPNGGNMWPACRQLL
jgi:hypothetical protein